MGKPHPHKWMVSRVLPGPPTVKCTRGWLPEGAVALSTRSGVGSKANLRNLPPPVSRLPSPAFKANRADRRRISNHRAKAREPRSNETKRDQRRAERHYSAVSENYKLALDRRERRKTRNDVKSYRYGTVRRHRWLVAAFCRRFVPCVSPRPSSAFSLYHRRFVGGGMRVVRSKA